MCCDPRQKMYFVLGDDDHKGRPYRSLTDLFKLPILQSCSVLTNNN